MTTKKRYKFTGMVTHEGDIISVSDDGSSIRYITKRDLQNHHLKYHDNGTIVTLEVFFKNDTPRIGKHISDGGRILDIVNLKYIDPPHI